jgi:hypothetical protein
MPVRRSTQNCNISYKRFPAGDYAALYNTLSTCDWSSLYNKISVDVSVGRLNVVATQTTDLAVPSGHSKRHKYPL